jgi:hypothetical protein
MLRRDDAVDEAVKEKARQLDFVRGLPGFKAASSLIAHGRSNLADRVTEPSEQVAMMMPDRYRWGRPCVRSRHGRFRSLVSAPPDGG